MMPWSRTRTGRLATATAALGCLAVLVTACGPASPSAGGAGGAGHAGSGHSAGHGHAAGHGHPATPSPSPSYSPSHTTKPSHAAKAHHHHHAGGGSATVGSAGCQSGNLGVTAGASQGTAGSVYATVTFTNRGPRACTLYGYPGVSVGTGTPFRQVGMAATENPSPPRELVTLSPGGVASAILQVADAGNYSSGQCRPRPTSELQVYPPNQTQALDVPFHTTGCAGPVRLLTVSVVQPGRAPLA